MSAQRCRYCAGLRSRAVGLAEMQHVGLESSGQLRGIVHADDALVRSGGLAGYFESRQLGLRFHVLLADLHNIDTPSENRLQEALEIALLLSCVRAQVEPGEAEAGLQTHQRSHTATIVALSRRTWGELRLCQRIALAFSRSERIRATKLMGCGSSADGSSRPLGKESTVVDVTRLTIQHIEEVFLQGLPTSVRLDRERAAGDL